MAFRGPGPIRGYVRRPAREKWRYPWDEADWENRTNLEIIDDLKIDLPVHSASTRVSQMRQRMAPHTVGRFVGALGHRQKREDE